MTYLYYKGNISVIPEDIIMNSARISRGIISKLKKRTAIAIYANPLIVYSEHKSDETILYVKREGGLFSVLSIEEL